MKPNRDFAAILVIAAAGAMLAGAIAAFSACGTACTGSSTGCAGSPGQCLFAGYTCPGEVQANYQKEFNMGYGTCQPAQSGTCTEKKVMCAQVQHFEDYDPYNEVCLNYKCTSYKFAMDGCL